MAILGLTSILGVADAQLPPEVAAGLPQLLAGLLRLLVDLKTQQESAEKARLGEDEDEEEVRGGGQGLPLLGVWGAMEGNAVVTGSLVVCCRPDLGPWRSSYGPPKASGSCTTHPPA